MPRSDWHHLYNHQWHKARARFLRANPLCVMCDAPMPASVVDHITPHRGDVELFWSESNWQPLCKLHHDSTKARMENAGASDIGHASDGTPLDRSHHWNK